jgi:hypothetical protein
MSLRRAGGKARQALRITMDGGKIQIGNEPGVCNSFPSLISNTCWLVDGVVPGAFQLVQGVGSGSDTTLRLQIAQMAGALDDD